MGLVTIALPSKALPSIPICGNLFPARPCGIEIVLLLSLLPKPLIEGLDICGRVGLVLFRS